MYCGVGGFALHAADGHRHVTGIELGREAILSAELSREELGLRRVSFVEADATAYASTAALLPPLVVLNPPRRGIGAELARLLDAAQTGHIIYSSCNADSLARDLDAMPGLRLRRARLLDMFPHTHHHEVLVQLERR
jgi:23S rRNA (uracil747-C5)-methyltransferase